MSGIEFRHNVSRLFASRCCWLANEPKRDKFRERDAKEIRRIDFLSQIFLSISQAIPRSEKKIFHPGIIFWGLRANLCRYASPVRRLSEQRSGTHAGLSITSKKIGIYARKRTKHKKADAKFEFTAWTHRIDYEWNLVSRLMRFAAKAFFRMKLTPVHQVLLSDLQQRRRKWCSQRTYRFINCGNKTFPAKLAISWD